MNKSIRKRWSLALSLVLFVFVIMIAGMLLAGLVVLVLHLLGILPFWDYEIGNMGDYGSLGNSGDRADYWRASLPFAPIMVLMTFSIFLGTTIAAFFSRKALNPILKVVDATQRVAQGDFDVRVQLKGVYELEELSTSFNKMVQELSSIETLREDFINSFSHEFKTPIVSIRGFAALLKDGNLTEEEKREYLDIIIVESNRLAELSTNILNLQKYESMEIVTGKTRYRLDEQIRRAVVMAEPEWSSKNLQLNVEMEQITFEGNEDLVQQIWLNLLDNAIKFSPEKGTVTLRLSREAESILFSIEDNGDGMDEQTLARAFDKFYQADASRAETGNGLGLAIVKQITELCGGRLKVWSEPGKGSIFSILLPGA